MNLVLTIYVDDCMILGEDEEIKKLKEILKRKFEMSDLGIMKYILGIQIDQLENRISIYQEKYIKEIIERFRLENCKGSQTPAILYVQKKLKLINSNTLYQETVRTLNYISMCTRPDISFAVQNVARKMQNPTEDDWNAVKRIIQYLKSTKDFKLTYTKNTNSKLVRYSDVSYA